MVQPGGSGCETGSVLPERLDESSALEPMPRNPLLLRRPLLQVGDQRRVGFVPKEVAAWIGLKQVVPPDHLQSCPRRHAEQAAACK